MSGSKNVNCEQRKKKKQNCIKSLQRDNTFGSNGKGDK